MAAAALGLLIAPQQAFTAPIQESLPAPTITVDPSAGLSDGTIVTFTLSGFTADTRVLVSECTRPTGSDPLPLCSRADVASVVTDASGGATGTLPVRVAYEGFDWQGTPAGTVNCRTYPSGCSVGGVTEDFTQAANAPIAFAP